MSRLYWILGLLVVVLPTSLVTSATAGFPGGAGRILVQRQVNKNVDLYTMSEAGKGKLRLTKARADEKWPAWSADGQKIAFTREAAGDEVWIMSASGKGARRLARNGWDPAWAPDGTRIAFGSDREGNDDIFVAAVTGGPATNLTQAPSNELDPAWSPDGTKIVFASNRNESSRATYDLFVMNADGTGVTQLTSGPEDDAVPNWSPDGSRIAFVRGSGGNFFIWVMNADGTDAHPITSSGSDYDPAWSPDGSRIVFISYRQGKTGEIYVMNADGTGVRRVTHDKFDDQSPDWQPVR
jgi:Tol biopolymer transport system component